jgi:putative ABC transport system permease protein
MSNPQIYNISIASMILTYFFASILLLLHILFKTGLAKDFFTSLLKMTIQLLAAGFILTYIFEFNIFYLTTFIYLFMSFFASRIIYKKAKVKIKIFFYTIMVTVTIVNFIILLGFLLFISRADPFYDAKYFIPIAGMILGNSMNAAVLALNHYYSRLSKDKKIIEAYLSCGATAYESSRFLVIDALRVAILPSIANMSGIGVVSLPGMMTGQILSGINPIIAVKYQISIMIAISSGLTYVSLLLLIFSVKISFNKYHQLINL